MRRPMMAGNWKMNKTPGEAVHLTHAIVAAVDGVSNVDCVICPPFVALSTVHLAAQGTGLSVGAQNMHWAENGAYTGEISAPMLKDLASYVIIGHSERRQYFAETDETVNQKTHTAFAHGLIPIVCVGESLTQNQAGETQAMVSWQVQAALQDLSAEQVELLVIAYEPIWAIGTGFAATAEQAGETQAMVSGQVQAALQDLSAEQVELLVIAYEPIWAIGTGFAATAEQAGDICGLVRNVVGELYGKDVANTVRVLYGGSTNEKNIGEIMQQPDIDGALIGGASLKAESYGAMVTTTSKLYQA